MESSRQRQPSPRPEMETSAVYRQLDKVSFVLIAFSLLFSPWAFGTTQTWSIWTMNTTGYLLGAVLLAKIPVRKKPKHAEENSNCSLPAKILAALTILILGYTLTSALNARATYIPAEWRFEYHHFISWLPHSYDSASSWKWFWIYSALACFFWNTRDWLLDGRISSANVPRRIRILLWIISINGALLAAEAIVQRSIGGNKLLFFQETRINKEAASQLGPFAYRSNGAQYLNLIWPLTLALWGVARHKFRRNLHHLLLPCAMLMIAAPVLSLSRGAVLVAFGQLIFCTIFLISAKRDLHWAAKSGLGLLLVIVAGFGILIGGTELNKRMEDLDKGFSGREEINVIGHKIAADYPLFGTGPGTMDPVYNLYRGSVNEYWPAQLHNDWLETLATFGWLGGGLIWLALTVAMLAPFSQRHSSVPPQFFLFLWLAVAGCLVHARYDFPFQIYSILLLFLVICAISTSCSLRKTK